MKFKSLHGDKAMFTYGKRRYRCQKGVFDTAGQVEEKDLIEYLNKNPNYVEANGVKAPIGNIGSDGLDGLSLDELKRIAVKEKVAAPSELDRVKSEETMIKKIRDAREAAE